MLTKTSFMPCMVCDACLVGLNSDFVRTIKGTFLLMIMGMESRVIKRQTWKLQIYKLILRFAENIRACSCRWLHESKYVRCRENRFNFDLVDQIRASP